ncbi:UDP-N-acetylglucosamine-N-acetylmuramylpentapeptide N-acetylglucosamine transferase [Chthonomonas calidirosea]|uniref:UDP-N-acetylglucosamine--N-acetylmuramyl-(pentapeptide) pyrophosphoryl-undecaprenol N-acetylglucosamine transferase n=1 Tax=Chthonomonas calidirosea (strain DSM 23976 / ICMP 18418 / T49) TaxID=1303518 RepID=S0EU48_CHTCT|nr:undecaprenyldiphospho-muramoylpentapeptide beta-N-acetylglucosaminyltransferase [Chthonomonas calidirosea]CCW34794.1 UDP-N-acetylglucosamine-N-acetylmuramylpentapeptide N-acetylglucosamine transferase [Chthonomonas calidirosea T49]CEK13776.1 UDP-N-acetylglucosamine-N-acetylmuramylpentapeptide N-acetylglucosamine transferase [Chthonomonas calidirosea]
MRVVVTGGGTGGHIFPALAVAESLTQLRPAAEVLYIGSANGMEAQIVPEYGWPFQPITARKLRKVLSPSTLLVLWSLWNGYKEARTYLRRFRAEAVLGTGGYVAAAAVLAAAREGIPSVICAPDVVPGRTNRLLARWAQRVCIAFPASAAYFPPDRVVLTGLPLRRGIIAPKQITPQEARQHFPSLSSERFTLLVLGGSQGARAINQVVLQTVPVLLEAGVQILHQIGKRDFPEVSNQLEAQGLAHREGYHPFAFLETEQMAYAYRAADLVVCRGGVSSLSEILANGLPSIVVPLPTAYADHQTHNARALEQAGAALLLPQFSLTPERLVQLVLGLQNEATRREQMRNAALALGRPDAAESVANEILSLVEARQGKIASLK